MSNEQKQSMNEAITWILRILTASGAFFLLQTYALMKETNEMLQKHMILYAAESRETEIRMGIVENEMARYRDERDRWSHDMERRTQQQQQQQ